MQENQNTNEKEQLNKDIPAKMQKSAQAKQCKMQTPVITEVKETPATIIQPQPVNQQPETTEMELLR